MGTLACRYLDRVIQLVEQVRDEEEAALDEAATLITDALVRGQRLFVFGCTHSALSAQDIVYRSGGLMLVNPLLGPGIDAPAVRPSTLTTAMEQLEGYATALLDSSPVQAGDVLIAISVSGRSAVPVEMAAEAKARGCTVIAVTSRPYSDAVDSRHPSGKMMHEHADVVLDNKAPAGDAVLTAPGVPEPFSAVSTVMSATLLHALIGTVIGMLAARGVEPPVFLSANLDGVAEHNKRLLDEHRDRIFYL